MSFWPECIVLVFSQCILTHIVKKMKPVPESPNSVWKKQHISVSVGSHQSQALSSNGELKINGDCTFIIRMAEFNTENYVWTHMFGHSGRKWLATVWRKKSASGNLMAATTIIIKAVWTHCLDSVFKYIKDQEVKYSGTWGNNVGYIGFLFHCFRWNKKQNIGKKIRPSENINLLVT